MKKSFCFLHLLILLTSCYDPLVNKPKKDLTGYYECHHKEGALAVVKKKYAFAHRTIDGLELLTVKKIDHRGDLIKNNNYQVYIINKVEERETDEKVVLIQAQLLSHKPEKKRVSYFIRAPSHHKKKRYFQGSALFQKKSNGDLQNRTKSHKSYCFQILL